MGKRNVSCIVLLSDFGSKDQYAASMKGTILSINPSANIIDITHEIQPYRVREGAYVLWTVYDYFPGNTIFVNVIDPGVGSARRIIIIKTKRYIFVAPDNGLLDFVMYQEKNFTAIEVQQEAIKEYLPGSVSTTFHGRDIMAPIAAYISKEVPIQQFGKSYSHTEIFSPFMTSRSDAAPPCILHIDHFGNLITNIKYLEIEKFNKEIQAVSVGGNMVSKIVRFYDEAPENTPCLVIGSGGLMEISVKKNNASRILNATLDSKLKIYWR